MALVAVLLLAGCGADDPVAVDPGSSPSTPGVPAAPGVVATRVLATVLDSDEPVLCLGPVAESWPPQCDGPRIVGWDWSEHRGTYEQSGPVRWGLYRVEGTWDGTTFTYQDAIPAASYDPAAETSPTSPESTTRHTAAELQRIADQARESLPGALDASVDGQHVVVEVVYDDGSLQDQVDRTYGDGVVVVVPQLVDVEG